MRKTLLTGALAAPLLLAACANQPGSPYGAAPGQFGMNKTTAGTVVGAGLGALAGSQIGGGNGRVAATALGTLFGALAGYDVGKSLDTADQMAAQHAMYQAESAPVGKAIVWNNPQNGHHGTVTPVRDGTDAANGAYCREFETRIYVDGRAHRAYGTACRQPDGSWKIVSQ